MIWLQIGVDIFFAIEGFNIIILYEDVACTTHGPQICDQPWLVYRSSRDDEAANAVVRELGLGLCLSKGLA